MKRERGFTLVELLVAIGITAVLAAVLLNLITQTLGLWERSATALAMDNEATLVIDRLVHDLESAVVRARVGSEWLRQEDADGTGANVLRLFPQTHNTSGDENDPATVREVTYRMEAAGPVYRLYRLEGTASEALQSEYTFATWPESSSTEFLLADNVNRLEVTFFATPETESTLIDAANWPALAKIELQLISQSGANRLEALASGLSNETREQILAETADEFVRWVDVGGRPW